MAIIFELFVECETKEQADRQAAHFAGLSFLLPSGREAFWKSSVEQTYSGTWSAEVWCGQISNFGICTLEDALETTECGIRLYHHLLSASEFLYAYTGFNPCCPAAELTDFLILSSDGSRFCPFTCVLSETLAQTLGPLRFFKPFRPGYIWNEYQGENYRPLASRDYPELLALKKKLLPS